MLETKLISLLSFLFFLPKEKSSKEIALVISGRECEKGVRKFAYVSY